jgi:hypothetical protein
MGLGYQLEVWDSSGVVVPRFLSDMALRINAKYAESQFYVGLLFHLWTY